MNRETIAALATAPGLSGLAVIRLSGEFALEVATKCIRTYIPIKDTKPNTIHFGKFIFESEIIDEVTASVFHKPKSYTGEDVVEISCHGGTIISDMILSVLINSGARLAEPGEFTKRAFLNGKMDLTQVEAVSDIIHSNNEKSAQTSARQLDGGFTKRITELRNKLIEIAALLELEMDFFDEDIDLIEKNKINEKINETISYCSNLSNNYKNAEILRSGYFVAIAGYPNSGKSTLFNALLDRTRAIVSDIPGTTRDYLEESLHYEDCIVRIIDTAGIRDTNDFIEIEGIKFANKILSQSNLILLINDATKGFDNSLAIYETLKEKYKDIEIIILQNKMDLFTDNPEKPILQNKMNLLTDNYENKKVFLFISAQTGTNINTLKEFIHKKSIEKPSTINDVLLNQRQTLLLKKAEKELKDAISAINKNFENEIVSFHIRKASQYLGEVTGETWSEEVLNSIFSKFCIGK